MKKTCVGILLLLLACASGSLAIPKPKPEPAPEKATVENKDMLSGRAEKPAKAQKEKFPGVVEKVDTRRNVVVVRDMLNKEKTLTFAVSHKTKISKSAVPLFLKDVKRGMRVTVEYQKEENKLSALSIAVQVP